MSSMRCIYHEKEMIVEVYEDLAEGKKMLRNLYVFSCSAKGGRIDL